MTRHRPDRSKPGGVVNQKAAQCSATRQRRKRQHAIVMEHGDRRHRKRGDNPQSSGQPVEAIDKIESVDRGQNPECYRQALQPQRHHVRNVDQRRCHQRKGDFTQQLGPRRQGRDIVEQPQHAQAQRSQHQPSWSTREPSDKAEHTNHGDTAQKRNRGLMPSILSGLGNPSQAPCEALRQRDRRGN